MGSDFSGEELSCTRRLNTISGKQSKSKFPAITLAVVRAECQGNYLESNKNKTVRLCPTTEVFFFQIFQELVPPAVPPPQESTLWAVKPAEKAKYDNIFEVSQLS